MSRTVRTLATVGAATAALTALTTAPAHAYDQLYVSLDGSHRATAYWFGETNQLCVHLARGYRATATLGGIGQVHDYGSNGQMVCDVVSADRGRDYRFTLTWVGTNGRTATRSEVVKG